AALETEFQRRLSNVAAATASQISPQDIADARILGDEGTGYANLEVQLTALRATTGLANASLFDSARAVVFDCRGPEYPHEPTRLDTLAPGDVAEALAGHAIVTQAYTLSGATYRAGLAPVSGAGGRVAGVVAVEGREDYRPVLARFRRRLASTVFVIALAVAILAALRIRAALDLLDDECRARNVVVGRSDLEGEAPVALDAESLKQVFLNLILNALEAMPEGGRLDLSRAERGGRFEFAVRDTGSGVAPEIAGRIGEAFVTTKARGSGLGLFLTRRL